MTYSKVRTFIIALVIGVVVALALGFGFGSMQAALFPLPPGTSVGDPASTAAAVAAMPLIAKLLLLAEWTVTDFAAVGAAILANDRRKGVAWAAWIYPLLATGANYSENPYPNWLMIAGALACPLTAWGAYQLVQAYDRRPPSKTSNAPAGATWDAPPIVIHAVWVGALALILPAAWFLWHPQQVGLYLFKGLVLILGGYVALMNVASLIGAGVGWIANPSMAHDDSQQTNGERLFRVSRWRETVMALGCAGCVGVFIWFSAVANPVWAIGTVAFALWTFVFGMQALFPAHLRLTATGFEAKQWTGPLARVAWTDIQPLYVRGGDRTGFVCFRYLEGRRPARLPWAGRFYRAVGVSDGSVPGSLYLAPTPMCALMNEMRTRAGGSPETGVSAQASPAPKRRPPPAAR